jgi:hypothetical protein
MRSDMKASISLAVKCVKLSLNRALLLLLLLLLLPTSDVSTSMISLSLEKRALTGTAE